ncbi:hypothetical protein [Streptomyces sp. NPDC058621]|uniref:hypothetical protein n=1 Tax=Streptomyces sp. NPDC058621 TaxID=3346561 RepID=UPI003648DEF5
MITREQLATTTITAAFTGGLVLVMAGATSDRTRLARTGACMALATLPALIITHAHRAERKAIATAQRHRREGYRLALTHASRGLLNPLQDNERQGATARDASATLSAVPTPDQA